MSIFGGGHPELVLELFAEGGRGEPDAFGDAGDGHLGLLAKQVDGIAQPHRVDVGGEGLTVGVGGQQVIQGAAADAEAVEDILALQGGIGVELFFADGLVDGPEQDGIRGGGALELKN